jgi:hypothetical protein
MMKGKGKGKGKGKSRRPIRRNDEPGWVMAEINIPPARIASQKGGATFKQYPDLAIHFGPFIFWQGVLHALDLLEPVS